MQITVGRRTRDRAGRRARTVRRARRSLKAGIAVGLVVITEIVEIESTVNGGHRRLQADILCRAVAGQDDNFAVVFRR